MPSFEIHRVLGTKVGSFARNQPSWRACPTFSGAPRLGRTVSPSGTEREVWATCWGKRPRSVANMARRRDQARDHIFGYTIFNDFSARDMQMVEMEGRLGPAKGKSFDGANVLGPWIVTPDEIGDAQALDVEVRVNGEVRSRGSTAGMLFSFEEILAHASQDETIHAGEFFGSGTVGNCCGLELGRFLEHGEVIEL